METSELFDFLLHRSTEQEGEGLTVQEIAEGLGETEEQVKAGLDQLVENGWAIEDKEGQGFRFNLQRAEQLKQALDKRDTDEANE